jgi:hypothetical protein
VTGRRRRPPAPPATPDLRVVLRLVGLAISLINLGSGTSYLLGGPAEAPSLRLLQDTIPIWAWGAALSFTGAATIAGSLGQERLYVPGYTVGVLAYGMNSVSAWSAFLDKTLTGASAPWTATGLVMLHMVGLWWCNLDQKATREAQRKAAS